MIIAILQARTSSTRLPMKVLKPILNKPLLSLQLERVLRAKCIDKVIVATSADASDDAIASLCQNQAVFCFRGSLEDVLDRFYQAAKPFKPTHVVRLTGDCPLIDPEIIDNVIKHHLEGNYDYTSNALEPTFPDGLDVEIMTFSALNAAFCKAYLPSHREHLTRFIYTQPELFKLGSVKNKEDLSSLRLTVDNAIDFKLVTKIYEALYENHPQFSFNDVLAYLKKNPALKTINTHSARNEGLEKSLQTDQVYMKKNLMQVKSPRYQKSQQLLEQALTMIPLGAQTFSKSITQYPLGISPHFIERGEGAHVWDVDGNQYIDFINGLAAINLGYNDPTVNQAVIKQLTAGVSFSLSHPIELAVAEKIIAMVPCAEMVRYGKNGSDVTTGAIRLARAYTQRDEVAVCGYHGWQDWYIGSTSRNLGVPKSTQAMTHKFNYNDLSSLAAIFAKKPKQIAAVILEPMNMVYPEPGFLEGVKALCEQHGSVLIFDEVVTGFRYARGGAQALFNVTPDLATFGKGIANGYPLSVLAGKKEIMSLLSEIFFSSTFGGETLSLAAAHATMSKIDNEPVIQKMGRLGEKIIAGVKKIITLHHLNEIFDIVGHPTWTFLVCKAIQGYSSEEIKSLLMQEIFARGILCIGTHNLSYAHSEEDINKLLSVYEDILPWIAKIITTKSLHQHLRCQPVQSLFKVR